MDNLVLNAQPREIIGKHVKQLRRDDLIPAVVYGKAVAPIHIQVPLRELESALTEVGEAALLSLQIEGEKKPRSVLVRDQQRDVLTQRILHADFYEVVMTETLRAHVPLVLEGEAPILAQADGLLIQQMEEVEVECLPGDLVPQIVVDVSGLETFDDAIYMKDLAVPKGIELLADAEEMIVKATPIVAEVEEEVEEEELIPVDADEVEVVGRPEREEAEEEEAGEE